MCKHRWIEIITKPFAGSSDWHAHVEWCNRCGGLKISEVDYEDALEHKGKTERRYFYPNLFHRKSSVKSLNKYLNRYYGSL